MLKKAWNDPVWSKVIAAAIIGATSVAATFFFGWWPAISRGISTVGDFLAAPSRIPYWAVLVMGLLSLLTVVALGAVLLAAILPRAASAPPDWTSYNSDVFLGLRWRWTYTGTRMSDPTSFCPTCDYQIHPQRGFDYGSYSLTEFHCDNCARTIASFKESHSELVSKAARLAQMKIRNGSWAA